MIMDSSDEEEEEEEEEEAPPPQIDFAAQAAAAAARSMATSAAKNYLKALATRCEKAVEDPQLQQKQLAALEKHATSHPEMQAKLQPTPPTSMPELRQQQQPAPAQQSAEQQSQQAAPQEQQQQQQQQQPAPAQQPATQPPAAEQQLPQPASVPQPAAEEASPAELTSEQQPPSSSPKPKRPTDAARTQKARGNDQTRAKPQGSPGGGSSASRPARPAKPAPQAAPATPTPKAQRSPKAQQAMDASLTGTAKASMAGTLDSYGVTQDIFLQSISKHECMPMLTFAPKLPSSMWRTNSNPAPGTYPPLEGARTSKYNAQPTYSVPAGKRFPPGPPKSDVKPGPGAYPVDKFERFKYPTQVTSSFGSAPRGRANPVRSYGPGPGEYEIRGNPAKDGQMFSMQGKFRKRGVLSYDDPGPGAYDPKTVLCDPVMPKTGFGTSLREDYQEKRERNIPGPGAYDVHKKNILGTESAKFSITSRRKKHDLSGYLNPGPGMYNHGSSFGYLSSSQ